MCPSFFAASTPEMAVKKRPCPAISFGIGRQRCELEEAVRCALYDVQVVLNVGRGEGLGERQRFGQEWVPGANADITRWELGTGVKRTHAIVPAQRLVLIRWEVELRVRPGPAQSAGRPVIIEDPIDQHTGAYGRPTFLTALGQDCGGQVAAGRVPAHC